MSLNEVKTIFLKQKSEVELMNFKFIYKNKEVDEFDEESIQLKDLFTPLTLSLI